MKKAIIIILLIGIALSLKAQTFHIKELNLPYKNSPYHGKRDTQIYDIGDNLRLTYYKPKFTDIFVNAVRDLRDFGYLITRKESLPWVGVAVGSTALLYPLDRKILDGVSDGMSSIGIKKEKKFNNLLSIGGNSILEYPTNLNSTLYWIGEGLPSIMIGAGLYTFGLINNDYRSLQTANQLMEEFLSMGVTCQLIKHITGRQSPWRASSNSSGTWNVFPNQSDYMSAVSNYDAIPSGHMATMMCTVTILSENYPEYKLIKPIGYTLMGAVGLAMMHNEVHWLGDYPVAIGIGYAMGKIISARGRKVSYRDLPYTDIASRTSIYPTFINKNNFSLYLVYHL
jgi:hypothetical protein